MIFLKLNNVGENRSISSREPLEYSDVSEDDQSNSERSSKSGGRPKARNWIFTWNNPPTEARAKLEQFGTGNCKYLRYQPEKGQNGTIHLQGMFMCTRLEYLTALKRKLSSAPHFEVMRGTPQQAADYCWKDDTRVEDGHFTQCEVGDRSALRCRRGKRSDLDEIGAQIIAGTGITDIAQRNPGSYIRYNKGFEKLGARFRPARNFNTTVYWLHGSTGTGKTRAVFEQVACMHWKTGGERWQLYTKDPKTKWWDGYESQGCAVIDDYRVDCCTFATLLRMFDRYAFPVEFKGGYVEFRARMLFITTPKSVLDTWSGRSEEDLKQLTRRIEHEIAFVGSDIATWCDEKEPRILPGIDITAAELVAWRGICDKEEIPKYSDIFS